MLVAAPPVARQQTKRTIPKWEQDVSRFLEAEGLPRNTTVWSAQKPTPLGLPNGKRELALIDLAWALRLRQGSWKSMQDAKQGYYINIHDSLQMRSWGSFKTLKQCSLTYSYEESYVFSGHDQMRLQGWAADFKTADLSDTELRSIAGEGLSIL
jgi:hypothetical protein